MTSSFCWLWTEAHTTEPPRGPGVSTTAGGSPAPRSGQRLPTGHPLWILPLCHLSWAFPARTLWPRGLRVSCAQATCHVWLQLLLGRSMWLCDYPRRHPGVTPCSPLEMPSDSPSKLLPRVALPPASWEGSGRWHLHQTRWLLPSTPSWLCVAAAPPLVAAVPSQPCAGVRVPCVCALNVRVCCAETSACPSAHSERRADSSRGSPPSPAPPPFPTFPLRFCYSV